MRLQARNDAVFVRPDTVEQTRDSGLLIPDAAQERSTTGVIVSAGPDVPASDGDRVMFSRYTGQDVEFEGETLVVMKAHDLLAVFT